MKKAWFHFLILFIFWLFFCVSSGFTEEPKPFGLILGKTSKSETMSILKKEGGRIVKTGYRVIKGDIVNPNVEGVTVKGLPVENLSQATFWFFQGVLFQIVYEFPLSMEKEEFYILFNQLKSKYGKPSKFIKPYLADGLALWKIKDVEIKLIAPWVSWNMYLTYTHVPLNKKVEADNERVFREATSKPKKGL